MADKTDHPKEDSRPFLASDDTAHQARLMNNSKNPDKGELDDSPAPILPPITQQAEEEPVLTQSLNLPHRRNTAAQPSDTTLDKSAEPDIPIPADPEQEPQTELDQPDSNTSPPSLYPSSHKTIAGLAIAVAVLIGFSAIWYNINQDIYTLGDQQPNAVAENSNSNQSRPATLGAEDGQRILKLSFTNLPSLSQGHYQLWIEQDDAPESLGSFTVKDGQAVNAKNQPFEPIIGQDVNQAKLYISIESGDDEANTPSKSIILSGTLSGSQAKLSFQAIDFSDANGAFTIAAPSDLSGDHQRSGIWFAKTDGQRLTSPSLNIPTAPDGWKYEGQVVYKGTAIAMGRFSQPDQTDDFYGFTPNPDKIPTNFPGEDYLEGQPASLGIEFPADLTTGEWEIIISIEPDHDGQDPTGDETFFLQPFTASIPKGAETHKEYDLKLDTSKFPTATIELISN